MVLGRHIEDWRRPNKFRSELQLPLTPASSSSTSTCTYFSLINRKSTRRHTVLSPLRSKGHAKDEKRSLPIPRWIQCNLAIWSGAAAGLPVLISACCSSAHPSPSTSPVRIPPPFMQLLLCIDLVQPLRHLIKSALRVISLPPSPISEGNVSCYFWLSALLGFATAPPLPATLLPAVSIRYNY